MLAGSLQGRISCDLSGNLPLNLATRIIFLLGHCGRATSRMNKLVMDVVSNRHDIRSISLSLTQTRAANNEHGTVAVLDV